MTEKTRLEKDAHKRFHMEFEDFTKWVMVDDLSNHERMFQKIKKRIKFSFPDAKFLLFGSTGANLCIKGSDIDIAVIEDSVPLGKLFFTSHKLLLQDSSFSFVQQLSNATVPIIKLKDKQTGISADLTFNRKDSYRGVHCALSMQI